MFISKNVIEAQKNAITNILGSIDKKIEINKKKIARLEAIAQDIYNYWFVQYEFPDETGKPYKSNGGKLVWNEELKRNIPVGWTVGKLDCTCSMKNGINYNINDDGDKLYKIINVRNISDTTLFIDESNLDRIFLQKAIANKYCVQRNSIIIARSGTPGAVRLINNCDDVIFCGFIICCLPYNSNMRNYLYYSLKVHESNFMRKASGSILKNVSQETLKEMNILIPSNDISIQQFNNIVDCLHNKITGSIQEIKLLSHYKSQILPLLMNGQAIVR